MDVITLEVDSPRYKCQMTFNHKVNIVNGDSGMGKTTFVQKVRRHGASTNVSVSDDFDFMILDSITFKNIVNRAVKLIKEQIDHFPSGNDKHDREKRYKLLHEYWSNKNNFPIISSVILIDDDDFITSYDFAALFNADRYNMYVIFDRTDISTIGFSVEAIYILKTNGVLHWIEPAYEIPFADTGNFDHYLIEGSGSDFYFFSKLLGTKTICPTFRNTFSEGGRTKIKKLLEKNLQVFKYKKLLLFVDICTFGSNFAELILFAEFNKIRIEFAKSYQSFEYLLLHTNLFKISNHPTNYLAYKSDEVMYEEILSEITKFTSYSYSKSIDKFKNCYVEDCCRKRDYECKLFSLHIKHKFNWLLSGTLFSYLLDIESDATTIETSRINKIDAF